MKLQHFQDKQSVQRTGYFEIVEMSRNRFNTSKTETLDQFDFILFDFFDSLILFDFIDNHYINHNVCPMDNSMKKITLTLIKSALILVYEPELA